MAISRVNSSRSFSNSISIPLAASTLACCIIALVAISVAAAKSPCRFTFSSVMSANASLVSCSCASASARASSLLLRSPTVLVSNRNCTRSSAAASCAAAVTSLRVSCASTCVSKAWLSAYTPAVTAVITPRTTKIGLAFSTLLNTACALLITSVFSTKATTPSPVCLRPAANANAPKVALSIFSM